MDLARLLCLVMYRAYDIDTAGRILAASNAGGSYQLTEIGPDGGMTALTALPSACTGYYLNPDAPAGGGERTVIVSHDHDGDERNQLSLLRLPRPGGEPATLADLAPLVHDPRFVHRLKQVRPGLICYTTNRRNGVTFDPVIRDLTDGTERAVAFGDTTVDDAALSPDRRWLALIVPSVSAGNSEQVVLADLADPDQAVFTDVTPAGDLAVNRRPHWLPGGEGLIVSSNRGREFTGVARYTLATGAWDWLVTDEGADLVGWLSPDGSLLLVDRNDNGASRLSVHDASTGAHLRDLPLPATGSVIGSRWPDPQWGLDSRAAVLSVTGATTPSDVLAAYPGTGEVRQVTHSVRGLDGEPPVRPEVHHVPTFDGKSVPCLVYRGAGPAGNRLAGSAVLVVHGGPEGQAKQTFALDAQAMAGAGHTVLVPNVRGSTGYGKHWYAADDGRQRLDSVADLAALHAYLPKLGLDPGRAGLWGGSYGGYMVLAGLAFQPELWAAGVDIVGISSLVTFLENTSAYRRAFREREYGSLATDRDFLLAASPLTRIDQIRAPLFIIHGANDPRVPLSEAEQIHAALTERGQECELLVYGDEGHGLAKRTNMRDAMTKATAFLGRHLAA
jgi:dipeptidyl aminopeptidase/acylaminoacyl peptidase